jgi:hypothetical protein
MCPQIYLEFTEFDYMWTSVNQIPSTVLKGTSLDLQTLNQEVLLKCQVFTYVVPSKSSRTDITENSCSHYMATKQMIQLATLADFIRSYKNAILTVMREMLFCTCICNTLHCKQGVGNLLALASHSQLSNDQLSKINS